MTIAEAKAKAKASAGLPPAQHMEVQVRVTETRNTKLDKFRVSRFCYAFMVFG